jgi:lysozyme
MSRLKKSAVASGLAVSLIGGFEGLRQTAYPDPGTHGKPYTVCFGATRIDGRAVRPGEHFTVPDCKALLLKDMEAFASQVEACTRAPMPDTRFVAFVSFAFNLGGHTYCTRIAPLVNAGRTREACDRLLLYNRAAGVVFPGLTSRRKREREFCMEGL